MARYDNVTLSPLVLQWGLRFSPIQRNEEAPGVIHTGKFFVLIPLKCLEKLTGVKDKYILGADPGGQGAHPSRAHPKIGKNMIFLRNIVVFHTKYPKNVRASLRSAQFF